MGNDADTIVPEQDKASARAHAQFEKENQHDLLDDSTKEVLNPHLTAQMKPVLQPSVVPLIRAPPSPQSSTPFATHTGVEQSVKEEVKDKVNCQPPIPED